MTLVAVTGPTGHVGANLVRQLLARGDRVRVLAREPSPPQLAGLDVELMRGDVRDPASLRALCDGVDVVYHLAAVISIVGPMGGLVHEVNVRGVGNMCAAAHDAKVRRLVHLCSVHAFQHDRGRVPFDETRARVDATSGAPAYDRSKADGERVVRAWIKRGLDAVILHPSGIIGPYDYAPSRLGKVFLDLYHRRLPMLLSGGFDFVDVRDVAASTIAAATRGRTGESYLVTGHLHSIDQLGAMASAVTGVAAPRLTCPYRLARAFAPILETAAKITRTEPLYTRESIDVLMLGVQYQRDKAARELGHEPRPTAETVRDLYAWFSQRGQLPGLELEFKPTHEPRPSA